MTMKNLPEFTNYSLGTGDINDKNNPKHIKLARRAMDAGIWFHSSLGYKGVFDVLKIAFAEDPAHHPPCIFKIDGRDPGQLIERVEKTLQATGKEQIEIVQLCNNPDVETLLRPGCPVHDAMFELLERELVLEYYPEVFWSHSENMLPALQDGLFTGYITFYNVVDREVSNELYDLTEENNISMLAMRTLSHGLNEFGPPDKQKMIRKELANLYERSNCSDHVEFRFRFHLGMDYVKTTIGATANIEHLENYLQLSEKNQPLDAEIVDAIKALHREWWGEKGIA